jgi:hypothetical protein
VLSAAIEEAAATVAPLAGDGASEWAGGVAAVVEASLTCGAVRLVVEVRLGSEISNASRTSVITVGSAAGVSVAALVGGA